MILRLGVIDQFYTQPAPKPPKGRRKARKAGKPSAPKSGAVVSTGDVAGWLETRYHVMEHYFELHGDDVFAPAIENSLQGAVESLMMGAPVSHDPFDTAMSHIEDGFRKMIDTKELDSLGFPGIPTMAAQLGHSKRFKNSRARRPPRPSFQDSGLYEASFKAWVD